MLRQPTQRRERPLRPQHYLRKCVADADARRLIEAARKHIETHFPQPFVTLQLLQVARLSPDRRQYLGADEAQQSVIALFVERLNDRSELLIDLLDAGESILGLQFKKV